MTYTMKQKGGEQASAYLQSRATRLECGGGGGAAGGDGETGIASGAPQDANRGRFGGDKGDASERVTSPHAVCELSVSVLRARRRAASASAIIGVGDASIMDEDAGTVWRGGDSYFRNSDWLFHRVARGDEGTLGAGLSSQPPKLPDGLQGIVLGIGLAMASRVPKLRSRRISCGLSARACVMSVMMSWFSRDDARGGVPASSGSSTRRIVAVVRGAGAAEAAPGLVGGAGLLARCWREESPSPLGEICGSSAAFTTGLLGAGPSL